MDLGLLIGTGWASGVNLYAVLALLGIAGRMDWFDAPTILEHPVVLGIAIGMYAIEFVADKVPFLDSAWDAAHTVIRPLGAAWLATALVGVEQDVTAWAQGSAGLGAGALALVSHATKATARLAINASPEPFTNVAASVTEDSLVAGMVMLAVTNPTLAIVAVVVLLAVGAVVFILAAKAARAGLQRLRARRHGAGRVSRVSGHEMPD